MCRGRRLAPHPLPARQGRLKTMRCCCTLRQMKFAWISPICCPSRRLHRCAYTLPRETRCKLVLTVHSGTAVATRVDRHRNSATFYGRAGNCPTIQTLTVTVAQATVTVTQATVSPFKHQPCTGNRLTELPSPKLGELVGLLTLARPFKHKPSRSPPVQP